MLARVNRIVRGRRPRRVSRKGDEISVSLGDRDHGSHTERDSPARFGFIVSKQVGGAVTRNTVKRRLRALAAQTLVENPVGYDVVVRAQAGSSAASLRGACSRLGTVGGATGEVLMTVVYWLASDSAKHRDRPFARISEGDLASLWPGVSVLPQLFGVYLAGNSVPWGGTRSRPRLLAHSEMQPLVPRRNR